ncbi:MAG: substrate-binding domain-containing protein [Candidatus Binatia bacterium]
MAAAADTTATDITVFSAGAVEPGMVKVIDAYWRETGRTVKVAFATAPEILKRIEGGETADALIAPPAVLNQLVKSGRVAAAGRISVGRIGIGVAVRAGAPTPKIATVDEFKQSLLGAESVVYNRASTGIYLEGLFERLGIAAQLMGRTTRYPDFAAVLDHMRQSKRNEIGLGATTVIIEAADKGLKLVGPLPEEIQNYTAYAATAASENYANDAAPEFIRYLTTPAAKAILAASGIAQELQ